MPGEIDLVTRLLAFDNGKASRIASHLRVSIQPHALVVCPLAMAGEDTTVHVVAIGHVGEQPEFKSIPDPRFRGDQYQLFNWLAARIETYFGECRSQGSYPQIWVSSSPVAALLDTLADRLRYNKDDLTVKRFGELLSYATERFPVAGQQALITATAALRLHFATGQQEAEDEHLGTVLVWIEPPVGRNVLAEVAATELIPMGAKTDPTFDRQTLEPLVRDYNGARRQNADPKVLARRAKAVHDVLVDVVRPIYDATQRAIRILGRLNLPQLPGLASLDEREHDEFENFMQSRDAGYHLPLRDKPKPAAFKLADREDALDNLEAAIVHEDRLGRARARLAGEILHGAVRNPRKVHTGPWRFEYSLEVVSNQRVLKVRRRDELTLLRDTRLTVVVTDIQRRGRTTTVSLRLSKGGRAVGLPLTGEVIECGPGAPDWLGIVRTRVQMADRLSSPPWTHSDAGMPNRSPQTQRPPRNLLAILEGLR
jgi:hypothetical protein